ncbi:MAG: hypothetical protein H7X83_08825 [Verrucomicrobia bacterium]|nr:hypothetical protein [Deltaproteobacteria bacterium]
MKKLLSFILLALTMMVANAAFAATTNPPPGAPGYLVLPFQISQQFTTTTAGVVRFKAPFGCRVMSVSASARASGGTTPTLTVNVKEAGTTILSAPVAVTAGTVSEAVISDTRIADEAEMTIDLAIGGTTPTWNDITVILVLKRL